MPLHLEGGHQQLYKYKALPYVCQYAAYKFPGASTQTELSPSEGFNIQVRGENPKSQVVVRRAAQCKALACESELQMWLGMGVMASGTCEACGAVHLSGLLVSECRSGQGRPGTSQMAVVASKLAVASWRPPGAQLQHRMVRVCDSSRMASHTHSSLPGDLLVQSRTVLSPLQLASVSPAPVCLP